MPSQRSMLRLAASPMSLPLLGLAPESAGPRGSAQTMEQVLASPDDRVTETRILECADRHYPTLVQVWRYTEATSIDQAQRSSRKMRTDGSRACMRGDRVKLVFLAPRGRGDASPGFAMVQANRR
mgnify:CR=1 FL=1